MKAVWNVKTKKMQGHIDDILEVILLKDKRLNLKGYVIKRPLYVNISM